MSALLGITSLLWCRKGLDVAFCTFPNSILWCRVCWNKITESQNGWGWKGPLNIIQSNPLPGQSHSDQVTQACVHVGLKFLQTSLDSLFWCSAILNRKVRRNQMSSLRVLEAKRDLSCFSVPFFLFGHQIYRDFNERTPTPLVFSKTTFAMYQLDQARSVHASDVWHVWRECLLQ